jgi:hypothetical protein
MITETDEIAEAIDEAARHWPGDRHDRKRLLMRLIETGHKSLRDKEEKASAARIEAVQRTAGALTGVYRENELERLREDWPE